MKMNPASRFLTTTVVAALAVVLLHGAQAQQAVPAAPTLTLQQAEQLALAHNPNVAVARLLALAEGQTVRETRAAVFPILNGAITAVDAHNGSRLTAGGLNNPIVYQRAAAGATVSQLITDFGRVRNLTESAALRAQAQGNDARATQADIVLAVDEAFFRALGSQQVLQVANRTVNERQQVADRVSALTSAKLKSDLDLNFANVSLAQSRLLALDARNDSISAMTALNALLGDATPVTYSLVDDDHAALAPAPPDPEPLVAQALAERPDLSALQERYAAAEKFSAAEQALKRPTVSALGAAGITPVRSDAIPSPWYGAVGLNISIPILNGGLFDARASEASLRAQAAGKQVEALRQTIARDLRTTVLQAQSNFERIAVTQQLVEAANSAFDLAQTRYRLGLSSIVELSQAELLQTQAQIDYATARYAYQGSLAALRFQTAR